MPPHSRRPPPLPEVLEERRERRLAAVCAALGIGVFWIAAVLNPYDDVGRPLCYGTHQQLGLPPCLIRQVTGLACPSCGMTTCFSLFMHGDLAAAWQANSVGFVLACFGVGATVWMLGVAVGLQPMKYAVSDTINWLIVAATITALARWVAATLLSVHS